MAIFNSYVKLPEGSIYTSTMDPMGYSHLQKALIYLAWVARCRNLGLSDVQKALKKGRFLVGANNSKNYGLWYL